jgi:hypothetical protein
MLAVALAAGLCMAGCCGVEYSGGESETPNLKSSADALRARYCNDVELSQRQAAERERRSGHWLVKVGVTLGTGALASIVAAQSTSDPTSHTLKGVAATSAAVGGVALLGGIGMLTYSWGKERDTQAAKAASASIAITSLDRQRRDRSSSEADLDRASWHAFQKCLKIDGVELDEDDLAQGKVSP